MKLVGDKTLSRSTKPLIIEAITCMLGTLQGGFMKYMVRFVHTLSGAMVVGKPTNPVDEEQEETCAFVDKVFICQEPMNPGSAHCEPKRFLFFRFGRCVAPE